MQFISHESQQFTHKLKKRKEPWPDCQLPTPSPNFSEKEFFSNRGLSQVENLKSTFHFSCKR
jgi:hypothetical protein